MPNLNDFFQSRKPFIQRGNGGGTEGESVLITLPQPVVIENSIINVYGKATSTTWGGFTARLVSSTQLEIVVGPVGSSGSAMFTWEVIEY